MYSEALLFDMDGTLTDSDPYHFDAFVELSRLHGVELTEEMFKTHISGQSNPAIFRNLFGHVDVAEHGRMADEKEALFRQMIAGKLKPLPGLVDFLDLAAGRGYGIAVVSNAPRANVEAMLAELGIADRFQAIVAGGEVAHGKPHPLPYLTGAARLGVPASRAIAFEDAPPGLKAAHAAGIATVGLTTSLSDAEARAHGADITIPDYRAPELAAFVDRVFARAA